jgi:integrase
MPAIKLTKHAIDKIQLTEAGQILYWDTEINGFGLRVGTKTKCFFCEKKINGKTVRVTLGRYPALPLEIAKKMASEAMIKMISGVNINQEKADNRVRSVTLEQVYQDFKQARTLKTTTVQTYDGDLRRFYSDWLQLQVCTITKDMIEKRHMKITLENGKASANRSGRMLRSILNFAIGKYELTNGKAVLDENPFVRISRTRQWHRATRRTGHLKPDQFPAFFRELDGLSNEIVADYIRFCLFTGCRRSEAASLRWEHVNLPDKSFTIVDPKNHRPIELPLSSYLMEVMQHRYATKVNEFVFPAKSQSGHIQEPKKATQAIGKKIGQPFSVHDLRRTYVTIAESLDVSQYALKALVNHKMSSSDVTAGYVQISAERLREPMQKITDFILKSANGY